MSQETMVSVPLSLIEDMLDVRNRIDGYYSGVDDDLFDELRSILITHKPKEKPLVENMYFCPLCEGKSRMFTKQALKQHRKDKHPGEL